MFVDVGLYFVTVSYFTWNVTMVVQRMIHLLNINRRWSLIFVSVQFVPLMTTIDVLFSKFFHQTGKTIFSRTNKLKNSVFFFLHSSHLLQADSQLQCDQWVNALQIAITNSFKSPNGNIHNSASVRNENFFLFFDFERKENKRSVPLVIAKIIRWRFD